MQKKIKKFKKFKKSKKIHKPEQEQQQEQKEQHHCIRYNNWICIIIKTCFLILCQAASSDLLTSRRLRLVYNWPGSLVGKSDGSRYLTGQIDCRPLQAALVVELLIHSSA